MFFKKVKPRRFDYTPIYYNEEKDPVAQERRIRFNKLRTKSSSRMSLMWLIALFVIAFYLYLTLKGV